jgi:hypothetical protein
MIAKAVFFSALEHTAQRPFRLVPFFDPGPWGGQWMREKFDLPKDEPNYAWCFDCVPEENSLVLGFGHLRFETPAQNLVLFEPIRLMGKRVSICSTPWEGEISRCKYIRSLSTFAPISA